jgi:hypothetical protein
VWLQFEENHMCGLQFDGKDKCVLLCYNEDTPVLIVELMSYALQQHILMCGFSSSQNHMCGFSSYIFICVALVRPRFCGVWLQFVNPHRKVWPQATGMSSRKRSSSAEVGAAIEAAAAAAPEEEAVQVISSGSHGCM